MTFRRLGAAALLTAALPSVALAQQPSPFAMPAAGEQVIRRGEVPADAGPPPLPPGGGPGGPPPAMPMIADTAYTSALAVTDGVRQPSGRVGGKSGDSFATGIRIASDQPNLNGVLVRGGKSAFSLSNASIDLKGTGTSDFLGIGAGAMAVGSMIVLRNVTITTAGAVRSATVAADGAVMKVYDSTLIAHGGPLPRGYVRKIGPGMMEAPAPLGISGTSRTNLTMGRSESYFYHSTLIANGWGALSTDATGGYVYLEANDCDVRVLDSGYGAYADGGAHVVLNRTKVAAATYTGIIAGSGEIRLNDVTGTAGRDAVMIHSVMGSPAEVATLRITGGNTATRDAAILIKSANADIVLDHATLVPANGVLIRGIVNDDANRTQVGGRSVPGVTVKLQNGPYRGDIVQEDGERAMAITLKSATLSGAIRGAALTLDEGSRWLASADSIVRLAVPPAPGQIDAPAGVVIRATAPNIAAASTKLAGGGMLMVQAAR